MNWPQKLRRRSLSVRIAQFRFVSTVLFVLLLVAFWEIQVVNSDFYRNQARQNRIKTIPIPAARGNIMARDGRVLAQSRVALSAMIDPSHTSPERLPRIARGLGLEPEFLEMRIAEGSQYSRSNHFVLKENLTSKDLAFLHAHRSEFREIDLIRGMRRQYPATAVSAHTIGYVGEVSKHELNQREYLLHDYGAEIGKSGVERQYDRWLAGENGSLEYLVDSLGRQLWTAGRVESVPGNDLTLTIDLDLQSVAELGLEGRKGAVVALDPRNGEILALASAPAFAPNKFVEGFSRDEWLALDGDPRKPMLNRAIQGTYAMGSVFKPIHGLAGLESDEVRADFKVHCTGGMQFGGRFFGCHKHDGHGVVDLRRAIAVSCDVYFYRLGHQLRVEKLAEYARMAGLGARTGVDLPDEASGLVPSIQWKVRNTLRPWHPGETIVLSIGQGAMSVTPLQAAHAIGGLAMGGVWHRPHLVSREHSGRIDPGAPPVPPRIRRIKSEHLKALRQAMSDVVNRGGTGGQARVRGLEVCGKTGTSQRVSNSLRLAAQREEFEDDAWFVGFAPCRSPQIVVAGILENGRKSSYAAALVRDVIQVWNLNRSRGKTSPPDGPLDLSEGIEG